MRSAVVLATVLALLTAGTAFGAELTDDDYLYLKTEFGLDRDGFVLKNASAEDQSWLHDLINDPAFKGRSPSRNINVGTYVFNVQMQTCQRWELAHPGEQCPVVADERAKPGWTIADSQCNACHLAGTTSAPSFFKLAKRNAWDEGRLADALKSGHAMSPITLTPQQLRDLAVYINSLN